MSKPIDNGGPAFPSKHGGQRYEAVDGMSLRDYFAAKAMQGMCANPAAMDANGFLVGVNIHIAYSIADAMLSERSKPNIP